VFQEVLKELINEKLPKLSAHFSAHGVDPTLFTLNWFLCLFVDDPLPVKTYLHIWDAFLFEGSKVSNVYHSLKIDINTIYLDNLHLIELIKNPTAVSHFYKKIEEITQ